MPEYNELEATDTMVVNNGESSYSVTVADVADGAVLEETDVFLVNRGEQSYTVTKKQLADEIAPDGVIEPPVVVLTPPNGAGMADEDVTPAAEGITGVVETTTTESAWNQDRSWSGGAKTGGAYDANYAFDKLFNGLASGNGVNSNSTTETYTIEINPAISYNKLEIIYTEGSNDYCYLNTIDINNTYNICWRSY